MPHLATRSEEETARQIKALSIALFLSARGITPAEVEHLIEMSPEWWRQAARHAGQREPSPLTIAEVISLLRRYHPGSGHGVWAGAESSAFSAPASPIYLDGRAR